MISMPASSRILQQRLLVLAVAVLVLQVPGSLFAQSAHGENNSATPTSVPVLVELFTSEGCSSCPPADIILQKLDEFQPVSGAQLIVLSEHVTYWDHDGWKDPNSSPILTERQSSYEPVLGEKESYTPQFVIDGARSVSLDHPQLLEEALNRAKTETKVPLRISNVTLDPSDPTTVLAHVESAGNFEKHNADVYVVVALNHVQSQVLRGENGGKQLEHIAVVQQLSKVGKLSKGKLFAQDVRVKLKPGERLKDVRLIAFAQQSGPGKLVGAAMWKPGN